MRRQIQRALHQVLQRFAVQPLQVAQAGAEVTERATLRRGEGQPSRTARIVLVPVTAATMR